MIVVSRAVLPFNSRMNATGSRTLDSAPSPAITFGCDGPPLDFSGVYGRNAPFTVEIGTGNGTFLIAEAERRPECDFLGIERSAQYFEKLERRIVRHGLANVRCTWADILDVFRMGLPPNSVDCIVSNFSDPWPKRRHRARRVFRSEFFPLLERVLRPGGIVSFRTDVGWYFNLTVTGFRRRRGWTLGEAGPAGSSQAAPPQVITNFERKAREAGSEVWKFVATWKQSDR